MRTKSVRGVRRGVTVVQVALVLGAITVFTVGSFFALGTATRGSLNTTATNAGDPSSLVTRFNH